MAVDRRVETQVSMKESGWACDAPKDLMVGDGRINSASTGYLHYDICRPDDVVSSQTFWHRLPFFDYRHPLALKLKCFTLKIKYKYLFILFLLKLLNVNVASLGFFNT